jgi:DNA-binding transcriptional LysR family regulator
VRQQLIERHVDLAVLPGVGEDSKIHAIPIKHHAPVVIVGPGHRWRDRAALDVHEIAREPMVARESGSNTQRRVDEGLKELGLTPRIVLRLGSREAVMEAVAADFGFGIVWEVEAQASTRVRSIPLTGSTIKSVDYLACMKDEVGRRVIKAFFSVLKEDARVTRTPHASARERPANAA